MVLSAQLYCSVCRIDTDGNRQILAVGKREFTP
jgi:hypothetical protein